MSLAGWSLAQLGVLFAVGGVAITGLYLLRMRRRQVVVPFAELWERVTRESETRKLWRRLRRVVSWLIQLGVLALLCLALGDPRPQVWLREPVTLAIVLDRSSSMSGPSANDPRRTRLDAALDRARSELRALGPADRAVVVAAGAEVWVPAPLGSDPAQLVGALQGLDPRPGEADLTRALALARSAVAEHPGPRILVLTDGALDPASLQALRACIDKGLCRVARVGGPDANVAITAFAARRYPHDREHVEVLAEVHNSGDEPAKVVLDVRAESVSVGRRELTLEAGQRQREILERLDAARSRLVARLHPDPAGGPDALGPEHDDVAHAIVPPLRPAEVTLVSDGTDLFLEAALLTLDDHVRLTGLTPEEAREAGPDLSEADVVIFDAADHPLPDPLPAADVLIFDPWRRRDSPCPIALKRRLRRPFLTESSRKHPILEHIVLKDVNIRRGTTFVTRPGDQVLVATLGEPIVVLREAEHGLLVFGFDPRQSDLPLRVAFPLLVHHIIAHFEHSHAGFVASLPVGKSRELALSEIGLGPDGVTRVEVTGPSPEAQPLRIAVEHGRFRMRALEPGIHRVRTVDGLAAGAEVEVAVNHGDAHASNLHDQLATLDLSPKWEAGPPPTPAPLGEGPLWTLILLAIACVIAIEWTTYHRRITV